MNHILREIKLSKLTDTPMSEEASKLVKFWDVLWADMKVMVDPPKGEIRCWKDGEIFYYFIQENENDYLWSNYYKVWRFFVNKLNLDYDETGDLIQTMVDEKLKYKVNSPHTTKVCDSVWWVKSRPSKRIQ